MLAVLVVQWMRQSDREARRVDRQLDREERLREEEAEYTARTGIAITADGTIPGADATRGAART
jgi:putative copper resistance protein D